MNSDDLVAPRLAPFQSHRGGRNAEGDGEKTQQMGIGAAVDRRGGDPYPQALTVGAGELVPGCARLHPQLPHQVAAVPAVPGRHQKGLPVSASSGGSTSISASTRPITAAIGVRSRPEMGGMTRRSGRSRGVVKLSSTALAGL